MTSAHPRQLDDLIAQARQLAREAGTIPSQNKLKAALHVRSERARTVLRALKESGFDPTGTATETAVRGKEPVPAEPTSHRLRLVPAKGTGAEPGTADTTEFAVITGTLPEGPAGPCSEPVPIADSGAVSSASPEQVSPAPEPVPGDHPVIHRAVRTVSSWPVILLAAPAMVAIWSGWVGLGALTGFGMVHPLPGIADGFTINSAITLPVGVEAYAAYALRVWLATGIGADDGARQFAKWSAIGSLVLGACGQVAYHLMVADHVTAAPWGITTAVSCLPVIVLGFGAALAHLQRRTQTEARR